MAKVQPLPRIARGQIISYWAQKRDSAGVPLAAGSYTLRMQVLDSAGVRVDAAAIAGTFQFADHGAPTAAWKFTFTEAQTRGLALGVARVGIWMTIGSDDMPGPNDTDAIVEIVDVPGAPS